MNLEQRIIAVETELAEMKMQLSTSEDLSKLVQQVVCSSIKNAQRPGGIHYTTIKDNGFNKASTSERGIEQLLDEAVQHVEDATS